jgi:hypothetical protein
MPDGGMLDELLASSDGLSEGKLGRAVSAEISGAESGGAR